jgi:ketosteroid isomerase-like protein
MIEKVVAYTNALNRLDLDAVERMFAENAIYISSGMDGAYHGRSSIMAAFRAYFANHPDQVNFDKHLKRVGPNDVQSDWMLTATNAQTGKRISRKGIQVITFNEAGLIQVVQVMDF